MTDAERTLWRALRETFPDARFRRQVPLGPYFADFASHAVKVVIEVDGGQHGSADDEVRAAALTREGFRVLRFWNHDVIQNTGGVVAAIADALNERNP